jgi:Caspase domain
MKKALVFLFFVQSSVVAQTFHTLLIADIQDGSFGPLSLKDADYISDKMATVSEVLNYKHQVVSINPKATTAQAAVKTLSSLTTEPDDIVFLYYTGLPSRPAKNKSVFPSVKFKGAINSLVALDEMETILKSKKVHLVVIMADCRNREFILAPEEVIAPPSASFGLAPDETSKNIKKLFLETCGVVKVSSAATMANSFVISPSKFRIENPAEVFFQERGSVFMLGFRESFNLLFDRLRSRETSFSSIFEQTQHTMNQLINPVKPNITIQSLQKSIVPCQN